jgi:hypothetical protein
VSALAGGPGSTAFGTYSQGPHPLCFAETLDPTPAAPRDAERAIKAALDELERTIR